MKKIKDILGILFYPVMLLITEFASIVIFTLIFNITNNYTVGSLEYIENLGVFFADNQLWMVLLSTLMLIPIFKKKCSVHRINLNFKDVGLLVLLGLSFGLTYNLILINLNFTDLFDSSNTNLLITWLSSGIIGPIIEELIFRNIVYEKLKKVYQPLMAILFTGVLFGILHTNIIQFIYAFLFNFILIFTYEKYKSIYAPIIVHISANSGLQLFLVLVNYSNIYISIISLIVNIVILIFTYKFMNKSEIKG